MYFKNTNVAKIFYILEAIKYKTIIVTFIIVDVLQLTFWEPLFSQPTLHS